jgi:hypothetical protein
MRILFNNIALSASVSATNQSITYLAQKLLNPILKKRFQSTTSSSVITFSWDSDQTVDCLFYGLHNTTSLTIEIYNSASALIYSSTVSDVQDVGRLYFTQLTTARTVDITISGSNPVYIGKIGLGEYYDAGDFLSDFKQGATPRWNIQKSPDGQTYSERNRPLRTYSLGFRDKTIEQKNALLDYADEYFPGPFFVDLTEGDQDFLSPIYATINEYPNMSKNGRRYDTGLLLEESR